jgi:toxin ParE1/3/4
MARFRLSSQAEEELDAIWLFVARESGSVEIATRVVDNIAERFWLLAGYPHIGRARDEDLRPGLRSLTADDYVILHRIEENELIVILHVVLAALFGH